MTSKGLLASAIGYAAGCLLQMIALTRYFYRLPDDWVGIGLYSITVVLAAIMSVVHFRRWIKKGAVET